MIIQVILPLNKSIILNENFLNQPDEIVFRSFSEVIQRVGKKNSYSRGSKVEKFNKIS